METFVCPVGSIEEQTDFAVDEIEYEDTSRQLYLGADVPVRTWAIVTPVIKEAPMQTLRGFYHARKGAYEAFVWICPLDGTAYTVRFVRKTWNVKDVDALNYQIGFSLRTG